MHTALSHMLAMHIHVDIVFVLFLFLLSVSGVCRAAIASLVPHPY